MTKGLEFGWLVSKGNIHKKKEEERMNRRERIRRLNPDRTKHKYRVRVPPGVWTVGLCTWEQVKEFYSPNAIEADGWDA